LFPWKFAMVKRILRGFLLTAAITACACADGYARAAPVWAGAVYILGAVNKPAGYPLGAGEKITILQAVALAGGPTETAKHSARVIIRHQDRSRLEIWVDLTRALHGKLPGIELCGGDILFV